jgi:hypothetical protein
MAEVYWIRTKEMTDMFSEGYIGFTSKTTEERWKGHLKEARASRTKNYPIYNNIRKYGDQIVVSTVVVGGDDYCLEIERKLRPVVKIGWNLQAGGNKGCDPTYFTEEVRAKISEKGKGRVFSEGHKAKIALANKNRIVSEETKDLMSEQRLGKPRPIGSSDKQSATLQAEPWRNRSVVDKTVWLMADKIHEYFTTNNVGERALAKIFGIDSVGKLHTIVKKLKQGWNPMLDDKWLLFKETYSGGSNV